MAAWSADRRGAVEPWIDDILAAALRARTLRGALELQRRAQTVAEPGWIGI